MFLLVDFVYENCLFRQFKVNELLFVEYKCVADELKLRVWAEHNYFIYVLGGKKIWQTLNGRYEITAGQAAFVKKGANIVHQFFDKDFCALIIFVPDYFIVDVIKQADISLPKIKKQQTDAVVPLHLPPVLSVYFQSVFTYFGNKEKPPAALLDLKFRELILNIISSDRNQPLTSYFLSLCEANSSSIREIMERNFIYNMKMEDFARLTGRSLSTFKRDFLAVFQTTPAKWLMNKKIEYAKHLLETTDMNINELSYDSGFENVSHFIKSFRQVFRVTPLQYKKKMFSGEVKC